MGSLRYDGRVALVTGSARGMGRAYAMLLAERGAKVVVNDLGGGVYGDDAASREPAEQTVRDIVDRGGEAVANYGDVGSEQDAQAMVDQAIGHFGRLDIVINNAGIARFVPFAAMTTEQFDQMVRVHLRGPYLVTRAAWPHLVGQGYGRVVVTCSNSILGTPNSVHYAAAKSAVIGLMTSLAVEGRRHGINVNAVWPSADTRMITQLFADGEEIPPGVDLAALQSAPNRPPELVAPAVAWLVHEDCDVTGQQVTSSFGRVSRVVLAQGPVFSDPAITIESVRDNWSVVAADDPVSVLSDVYSSGAATDGASTS